MLLLVMFAGHICMTASSPRDAKDLELNAHLRTAPKVCTKSYTLVITVGIPSFGYI